MIGKIIIGKSFGGCIRYTVDRSEATILCAEGVRTTKSSEIAHDFNLQRKANPGLGKSVGHVVLSWSKHDQEKLTPEKMAYHAKEYLFRMKIEDTQYIVIQHTDREHPHVHIIYNRVANNGKTIPDKYQKVRNAKVCKHMTKLHGFHMALCKVDVKRERLKGADKVKYEIYDTISKIRRSATNWMDFQRQVSQSGITLVWKQMMIGHFAQGLSFSKGDVKFKGSEVDRSMSYKNLNERIVRNAILEEEKRICTAVTHPNIIRYKVQDQLDYYLKDLAWRKKEAREALEPEQKQSRGMRF